MTESAPAKPDRERNGTTATAPEHKQQEIRKHVNELLSDDYSVRAASASQLEKYGSDAAEAIVDTLIKKSDEPHKLANFSDALAEIGKPSLNVILHALNHISDIRREQDVYVLQSFVDLLDLLRDRRAVTPLLEQLGKLDAAIKRNHNKQLVHCAETAKVRIHRLLAGLGERGGLDDLLGMLGDGRRRVRDGVVDTLARVGDKRAVAPLVRLHIIEEPVSYSGANVIKEAIRDIARRENVSADDRGLKKDLTAEEKAVLESLLSRAKNGNGNGSNGNGNGKH